MGDAVGTTVVEVTKNEAEFVRGVNAFRWRNPWLYVTCGLALGLLVFAVVSLAIGSGGIEVGAGLVMSVYMLGTTTYNMTLGPRRAFRRAAVGPVTWTFDVDGVEQSWSNGTARTEWSSIRSVRQTSEFLLMYVTRQIGLAIPTRALSGEQVSRIETMSGPKTP